MNRFQKALHNAMTTRCYQDELNRAFDLCVRAGFVTKASIPYLTGENGDANIYRFIDAMNKSGLFRLLPHGGYFPAWALSEFGLREAKLVGLTPVQPPDNSSFLQEATLLNLALEFERRGLTKSWAIHNQLKCEGNDRLVVKRTVRGLKYPDLLIQIRSPKAIQVGVEVLAWRFPADYERLLRGYMTAPDIDLMLIVHLGKRVKVRIEQLTQQKRFSAFPILLVDLRDLFREHDFGPARSVPLHDGFTRIINEISDASVKRNYESLIFSSGISRELEKRPVKRFISGPLLWTQN